MAKPNLEELKKTWEGRASSDPMFYIDTDVVDGDSKAFFENGEKDVARFVDPFIVKNDWDASALTALDLGCGMGRLSRALGRRFKSVHGFDISETMIAQAKACLSPEENHIHYFHTQGDNLKEAETASIDFVFSFIVLQHVPTAQIVLNYFKEFNRVLSPQGKALVQVNGVQKPFSERFKLRIERSNKVPVLRRKLTIKVDPHSSMGVSFSEAGIRQLVQEAGLQLEEITGTGEQYMWLTLKK